MKKKMFRWNHTRLNERAESVWAPDENEPESENVKSENNKRLKPYINC